jgi:Rad3-related DNA helicase
MGRNVQDESQGDASNLTVSDFTTNFTFKDIRPKQAVVLEQIANAIKSGFKYIILEAPTGFGKSPVAIAVARTLGSSYICSATKDLQTQYTNDFPFLKSVKGMGNFSCLVKEDFILNKSYVCSSCNIDQRQNNFYQHSKECKHTTVSHGPCRDKSTAFAHIKKECSACLASSISETGDGKIDFHNGCRYRTYPEDYELVFPNTDKEDVFMNSVIQSEYQKYSTEKGGTDGWMHLENINPTTNTRCFFTPCEYYDQLNKGKLASHTIFNYANFLIFVKSQNLERRKLLILDEGHQIEKQVVEDVGISISKRTLQKYIDPVLLEKTEYTYEDDISTTWLKLLETIYDELENAIPNMASRDIRIDAEQYLDKLGETVAAIRNDANNWIVSEISYNDNSIGDKSNYKRKLDKVTFKPLDVSKYCRGLFNQCDITLIMSATILDFNTFCRNVGLGIDKVKFIEVGSDFPVGNRPIYQLNTAYLNYSSLQIDTVQTRLAETIDKIMSRHANEKGIIHTTSYAQVRFIEKLLSAENRDRLISTDPEIPREKIIAKYWNGNTDGKDADAGKRFVLISPSLHTGLDLKDEQSRFQIVVKIPYPSKADRWIAKKLQLDGGRWYNWQTALRLVQACGRSIRSKDDWAKTYVLDSAFGRFARENKLPAWFKEAII